MADSILEDWKLFINDDDDEQVSRPTDFNEQTDEEFFDELLDRKPTQATVNTPDQPLQDGLTQSQTFDESQWQAEANQSYTNDFAYPPTPAYDEPGALQSEFGGPYFAAPNQQEFQDLDMDFHQQAADWPTYENYDFGIPPVQQNTANPLTPNGIVRLQAVPAGGSPYSPFPTPTPAPRPISKAVKTTQSVAYQHRFRSFEDAHAAIAASNTQEHMIRLNILGDDWEIVHKNQHIHAYASQLLNAATIVPSEAPQIMTSTDYQKTYWLEHQQSTLFSIQNMISASPERAEARCLLAIEAVLHLHQNGCPASVMGRKTLKEGYKVDTSLIASARLEQIIFVATNDKYVAHDILTGTNLPDIVRSPMAYMRRKADNSRVNAKKAMDKEEADRSKGLVSRKKGGGGRRKGSVPIVHEHAGAYVERAAYVTPAPSSPAASFYEDVTPIPFSLEVRQQRMQEQDEEDMEYAFE